MPPLRQANSQAEEDVFGCNTTATLNTRSRRARRRPSGPPSMPGRSRPPAGTSGSTPPRPTPPVVRGGADARLPKATSGQGRHAGRRTGAPRRIPSNGRSRRARRRICRSRSSPAGTSGSPPPRLAPPPIARVEADTRVPPGRRAGGGDTRGGDGRAPLAHPVKSPPRPSPRGDDAGGGRGRRGSLVVHTIDPEVTRATRDSGRWHAAPSARQFRAKSTARAKNPACR